MKTPGHSNYTGPGPCEFYRCPLAAHCKANALACDAFAQFVFTGKVIRPDREIIPGTRKTAMRVTDKAITPVPSRTVFNQIYNSRMAA